MHALAHFRRFWLFLIALFFVLPAVYGRGAVVADREKRFVIVIDPGHGGGDPGACGAYSKEKNINLKVALEVGRLLKAGCPDVKVIYTRRTDVFIPLQTRADIANRNKADLFISIHTNSLPKGRTAYGSETYTLGMARAAANLEVAKRENAVITYEKNYQQTYEGFDPNKAESYIIFELLQDRYMKQSVDLAQLIQQQYTSNGRRNKGVHQAGFLVLRKTSMPAVLTELGFISTPDEERYLNSAEGISVLARSIYNGILKYRGKSVPSSTPTPPSATTERDGGEAAPPRDDAHSGEQDRDAREKSNDHPAARPSQSAANEAAPPSPQQSEQGERRDRSEPEDGQPPERAATDRDRDGNAPQADDRPVFKVQLLATTQPLKADDRQFKGLKPVDSYKEGRHYKYTYGSSHSYAEIRKVQKSIAAKFPQTFIVAFVRGERVNLNEAIRMAKTQK